MALNEHQMEQLDNYWYYFEEETGHRSPTKEVANLFVIFLDFQCQAHFTWTQLKEWFSSYFIPEAIPWLEDY